MIGTIEEEYALCEKAFEGVEVGSMVRCLHHSELAEVLTEPIENRLAYILEHKEEHERAIRFHEMRPVPDLPGHEILKKAWDKCDRVRDEYDKARDEYDKTGGGYIKARDDAQRKYNNARVEYKKARDRYNTKNEAVIIALVPDTVWTGSELRFTTEKD